MKINTWLWLLWIALIFSMFLKWKIDTYMLVAVIILPILVVLLDLQEEVNVVKEEAKHQRKYVETRLNALQERIGDLAVQYEKKLVVDFSEFARNNPSEATPSPRTGNFEKTRATKPEELPVVDFGGEDFLEDSETEETFETTEPDSPAPIKPPAPSTPETRS